MRKWLVEFDEGKESVEADLVEITASGVLLFYRTATRMEKDRTLLRAFSPGWWRRCQFESGD